jgi:hypothetical protein
MIFSLTCFPKVYDAVAKLRRRNIVLPALIVDWITIHDGKVRFDPNSMFYARCCSAEDGIDDIYERDVWPCLDEIFAQIKKFSNAGHISLRWFEGWCVPLQPVGDPQRHSISTPFLVLQFSTEIVNIFDYYLRNRHYFLRAKKRRRNGKREDSKDAFLFSLYEQLLPYLPIEHRLAEETIGPLRLESATSRFEGASHRTIQALPARTDSEVPRHNDDRFSAIPPSRPIKRSPHRRRLHVELYRPPASTLHAGGECM